MIARQGDERELGRRPGPLPEGRPGREEAPGRRAVLAQLPNTDSIWRAQRSTRSGLRDLGEVDDHVLLGRECLAELPARQADLLAGDLRQLPVLGGLLDVAGIELEDGIPVAAPGAVDRAHPGGGDHFVHRLGERADEAALELARVAVDVDPPSSAVHRARQDQFQPGRGLLGGQLFLDQLGEALAGQHLARADPGAEGADQPVVDRVAGQPGDRGRQDSP